MTWIKICGMTNLEDAQVAVDAGADAVGFVFYERSPRCVGVEKGREMVARLPESVEKVGVFAGESLLTAAEVGASVGLDSLQIYPLAHPKGLEILSNVKAWPPAERRLGQRKIYLALPMSTLVAQRAQQEGLTIEMQDPDGKFVALVLDSGSGQRPGGTGVTFDWDQAAATVAGLSLRHKVAIAGGLTPENVAQAIGILRPWGVDVASGVEASPGKKDPQKVRAFVRAVREIDGKAG
jgi:phosphoribosylanthranilate isomerase